MQRIEIKSEKDNGSIITEVYIDGKKIEGVRSCEFKQSAGSVPVLQLDINALNVSIDSPAVIMDKNLMKEMRIEFGES